MKALRVTCLFTAAWLLAVAPQTETHWGTLRGAITRAVDVVALPFRLVWLATQPPDEVLLMPVASAKVARVADSWGAPRPRGRTHRGQDIFARHGTAVLSATEGYVVRVGHNALGGKVITVAGAGRRRYYYAHLSAFAAETRVGAKVTPDTVIGFVGNTGNAAQTPAHLHFAVYTVAGVIDPLPLLRDRPS